MAKSTKISKELMGASTGLLVLSVIAREADYGYSIVRRINEESEGLFAWHEGTVYPVLHKLEKEGLLRTEWQESSSGRRRKYYRITQAGRKALAKRRSEWAGVNEMILSFGEATNG